MDPKGRPRVGLLMSTQPTPQEIDLGDGRSLACVEAGSGRPIVLLHGAMTSHEDWAEAFGALSRLGRVIAIDRPGHGASRRPRFEASSHAQARQIHAGLERLGVKRPLMVGHSFGGIVAMAYGADFPEETAGLVLAAPLAFPEVRPAEHLLFASRSAPFIGPMAAEMARLTDPALVKVMQRLMFAPHPVPPQWRERYPIARILSREQTVQEGEDAASIFPGMPEGRVEPARILCPVHILAGDKDMIALPSRHAKRLARMLPDAKLTMVEGVGHMVHVLRPDTVVGAVRDMLAAEARQGRKGRGVQRAAA